MNDTTASSDLSEPKVKPVVRGKKGKQDVPKPPPIWLMNRLGRRLYGVLRIFGSFFSEAKCEVCAGPLGVVTQGQIKFYCSKLCRLRRHRRTAQ